MESTAASGDADLRAEIGRRCRRRMDRVYLLAGFALLSAIGMACSLRMMHGAGVSTSSGRIVALGTSSSGESTFTAEFADADGLVHRDTEDYGYHYASGDPQLGEPIEYVYQSRPLGFHAVPRADWILQWMFGIPLVAFVLLGALGLWLILRERAFRLWLLQHGRREPLEQASIRERTLVIPAGASSHALHNWRLEGRYFLPSAGEYVDCHGDWEMPPMPQLVADSPLPPLLVHPDDARRYWLPAGALVERGRR